MRGLPFLEADASLTYERISQHGVFAALNPEVAGIKIMYGIINPLSFRYEFDSGENWAMLEAALGHAAAEEAETAEVRLRLTTGIALRLFPGTVPTTATQHRKTIVGIRRDLKTLAEHPVPSGDSTMISRSKSPWADYEAAFKRQAAIRDQLMSSGISLARLAEGAG